MVIALVVIIAIHRACQHFEPIAWQQEVGSGQRDSPTRPASAECPAGDRASRRRKQLQGVAGCRGPPAPTGVGGSAMEQLQEAQGAPGPEDAGPLRPMTAAQRAELIYGSSPNAPAGTSDSLAGRGRSQAAPACQREAAAGRPSTATPWRLTLSIRKRHRLFHRCGPARPWKQSGAAATTNADQSRRYPHRQQRWCSFESLSQEPRTVSVRLRQL